jgi:hypothetical protein
MTRAMSAAVLSVMEERRHIIDVPMVYIEGRDRVSGDPAGIGLWRGEFTESIIVPDLFTGIDRRRTFYSGGLLEIGPVRFEAGLSIRPTTIRLSSINDAVLQAIRGYDARGATVQVWKRAYDPDTRQPINVRRWFKGFVNSAPSERPAPGGEASIEIEVVSQARMLTITSGLKKSHAAQQRREGDQFRKYKATAGDWSVPWGSADERHGGSGGGGNGGGGGDNGPGYDDGGH